MLKRAAKVSQSSEDEDVNVTPLLDIVFIMLIFFIVTATFIKEPGVDVERPDATMHEDQPLVSLLVAITAENEIWINREKVELNNVRSAIEGLRRENPRGTAVIQADSTSHTRLLVRVLQAIRDAGVNDIVAVSTEQS